MMRRLLPIDPSAACAEHPASHHLAKEKSAQGINSALIPHVPQHPKHHGGDHDSFP